jgi:thiol-disulfide isomerase/thioredoxin
MGTSLTNVTAEIVKFKVASEAGVKQEFYVDAPRAVNHEQLEDHEVQALNAMPESVPQLDDKGFDEFVQGHDLVLVAFGAPWCPWSQRLEPVWRKTYEELKKQPYAEHVRMGKVDCTSQAAQQVCQRQHIHAFPTIRIYRHKLLHSHENYLGDRDSSAFLEFMAESLPHKRPPPGMEAQADKIMKLTGTKEVGGQAVESHTLDGEGCQLTGSVSISRVPGTLRISATSESHSFNTRVMNVSHHVDRLLFSSFGETHRLRHVLPLEQRSGLLSSSYKMHQELATLKHYLKVVPFQYAFLDGETQHTYLYKANYNEYKPRKLEWYEGQADAYVDTDLTPNAAFYYDISPVMVVMREETQSFSSFVTKICAVIGGIYTVVGLLDSVLYHGGEAMKKQR